MKILNSSKLFFTSDLHFGHKNIINFSNRPYTNIETMDDALIRNWNAVVPHDGIVFILGDFSFYNGTYTKYLLGELNGRIILIQGNHDKQVSMFKEVHQLLDIKVVDNINGNFGGCTHLTLCHFQLFTWNRKHHGAKHLYGHSHGTSPHKDFASLDVGVDCWDYTPVSYKQLTDVLFGNKTWGYKNGKAT